MSRESDAMLVGVNAAIEGVERLRGHVAEGELEIMLAPLIAQRASLVAEASGSGALSIAGQGRAVSAGAGGVAVGGSVYGGIQVAPAGIDPRQAIEAYRRVLALGCRQLPLRGIDIGASDPTGGQRQLELDQVYVGLDTTSQVRIEQKSRRAGRGGNAEPVGQERTRPLTALEAAAQQRCVVILGDPGSGKSTFLSHLGLCLAAHGLDPTAKWGDRLPGWPAAETELLPVPVVLRDFVRALPENTDRATPCLLWDFIVKRLRDQNLEGATDPIRQALDAGRAIVLLDGLDEIPTASQRAFVRDAVQAFAARHHRSRMVVTCRTLAYQEAAWKLSFKDEQGRDRDCPAFALAAFDGDKIDRFIAAWFGDLAALLAIKPEEAPSMTLDLRRAVRRPDLWRLAPNPLLLTVMALVHTHKGRLPDARALLYEDAVDILLWRWEQMKLGRDSETSGLRQLMLRAGVSDVDLKRALWQLAFEAHRQGGAEARLADIGEVALQDALAAIYPVKQESRAWVGEVIETIKLRAGLLVERTTHVFTFPHRTFQEYLAGAFLASLPDFAIRSAALAKEGGQWRDVILLAVGRLVYLSGDIYKPLGLVSELCPAQRTPFTDEAWRCAWLAGDVIVETGLQRAFGCALGQELVARVRRHLVALVETGALTPVEQAAVGVTLGKLGDSRKGVGVMARECGCALPDIDWVEVPPGPFVMGSKEDDSSWGDERPQFTCDLIAKPYRVSRYPITVAQFRCFVEARGYENERFWTGAGWAWRQKESVTGPEDYGEVFQTPNHPRVGVSWYEAMAFCAWLAAELGLRIGLPSEPEWERAARHTDGRLYPWGNEQAVKSRCNMGDTGIGSTSAVGLFPSGAAICGAEDMAGNVWEWCRTAWTSDYEDYERRVNSAPETSGRVVRGGSFGDSSRYCRCAFRLRVIPNDRDVSLGFRVLASPVS